MGKIAFVFAGQGAQHVGMGRSLYDASPAARAVLDRAETIRPGTLSLCFDGPSEALSETLNTQPCLFAVDLACAAAVEEAGFRADCAAGFSLGELAAAAFCGYMAFDDALRLVIRRAELMQEAAERNPGGMAAVLRLSADQVEALAGQFDRVYPVNYNCPGQTVVACGADSLEPFCAEVARMKGRALPLNVSGAFHSPLMDSASTGLAEYLRNVPGATPGLPLYANGTGEPYPDDWRAALADQLSHPVLWERTVRSLGADAYIELGPGATLCGLIRKTLDGALALSAQDAEGIEQLRAARAEGKL